MVLSLTKISLSLIKYLHSPNPAILTFVNYAVSAPILIAKQPIPSPPPLSTLNLTTVKGVFRAVGTGPCPLLPQTGEKKHAVTAHERIVSAADSFGYEGSIRRQCSFTSNSLQMDNCI